MGVDPSSASDAGSIMFGLPGFRVLAAGEVCGELELLVETTVDRTVCPECGWPAAPHDRREHLVRDIAQGDRPVLVLWCKRIWRCRMDDCPQTTWSERAELAEPKATLTNYDLITNCYSDVEPPKGPCDNNQKRAADLDDDGTVGLVDLNLFLRQVGNL